MAFIFASWFIICLVCCRMYQALLAAGDDRSANFMLKKIPQDDAEVCAVIVACQETYNGFTAEKVKKKKQGKRKKEEKSST